jgi:hypothetical protein
MIKSREKLDQPASSPRVRDELAQKVLWENLAG